MALHTSTKLPHIASVGLRAYTNSAVQAPTKHFNRQVSTALNAAHRRNTSTSVTASRDNVTTLRVFQVGLLNSHTFARLSPRTTISSHSYSTIAPSNARRSLLAQKPHHALFEQYRTLFAGNVSRSGLSHLEQTANNNPSSATAQNAFYAALLRANMPEIIKERFETGRYATNAACEKIYISALERADKGVLAEGQGQDSGVMSSQVQSIGQAIAAKARGANVAKATGGSGAKDAPLYVVVEESAWSHLFRFVKFALWFGLLAYFLLVVVSLVIETSGMLRKVGGSPNAEAKPELQTTRFSDVHGCDEAKEELQELVEFLKAPAQFSSLGGKLPKGVLLVGPPGTGKTLLARAVAGEAGVPFFYMSGSEFDEVYVGVGAKRVRELFATARQKAPAIVFIDELDAIGGKRNDRDAAYVKQTLNQLLTDLDGFDQDTGVIFLAATNFPESLDKALTRPGRFDRRVEVPIPDVRGRIAILKHHTRKMQLAPDVDVTVLARGTIGFSGAELQNLVNQAAVRASRNKAKNISMLDMDWAKDKLIMGAERRSAVIQEADKLSTAYHEGGHALVALLSPHSSPLYKVTIMPRGGALGITSVLPEMDVVSRSKQQYLAQMDVSMGGKAAEELIYKDSGVSSGPASDLQNATRTAYAMVTMFGMSEELGHMDLQSNFSRLSPQTKAKIETEVRRLLQESYDRAKKLLTDNREQLDLLAQGLVKYETLNKAEIEKIIRGESLPDHPLANQGPIIVPETPSPPPGALPLPPIPGSQGSASGSSSGGGVPKPGSVFGKGEER